jgi:hypothetical protein
MTVGGANTTTDFGLEVRACVRKSKSRERSWCAFDPSNVPLHLALTITSVGAMPCLKSKRRGANELDTTMKMIVVTYRSLIHKYRAKQLHDLPCELNRAWLFGGNNHDTR